MSGKTREPKPFLALSIADIADRTIDAFQSIMIEVPSVVSVEELAEVFLGGDRKIYTGIILGVVTLLMIVFAS